MKENDLKNKIITMKFGGVVLKNKEGFNQLQQIIKKYSDYYLLIVISAFSTATRELKESALLAENGEEEKAKQVIDRIKEWHIEYAKCLLRGKALNDLVEIIEQAISEIKKYLRGIAITKDLTTRTLDLVMSYGEFLALSTVHFYLVGLGIEHKSIDSRTFLVTDNEFGNAKPLLDITTNKIKELVIPEIFKHKIVVTQGFVAQTQNGLITTMGIESSNLTATLLAGITNSEKLIIWTDTEGIRSCDPKLVSSTKLIPHLNYNDAYYLGINGLKLIYPKMIEYAQKYSIELEYRSAMNIDGEFTTISVDAKPVHSSMIIVKDNQNLVVINRNKEQSDSEIISYLIKKLNDLSYLTITSDIIKILSSIKIKKILDINNIHYNLSEKYAIITINNFQKSKENHLLDIIKEFSRDYHVTLMEYSSNSSVVRIYLPENHLKAVMYSLQSILL